MNGLTKSLVLWRNTGGGSGANTAEGYPPAKCMNLYAKATDTCVKLTWTDPDDISVNGGTATVSWAKTVVVRKLGSFPTNETDGTIVVTSTVKNQYQSTPYEDNITNGASYYYAAFACSSNDVYNMEDANAIPDPYTTMTIEFYIKETPDYGNYLDDAVNMPNGKTSDSISAWQEFFGYKPCLFKNGQVVGYLNPNDYTKFENGTSADITSGNAGDVMVEFPRRGIKIDREVSNVGTKITVSMTNNPNADGFSYNAHRRGDVQKDYFYIGAYLASTAYDSSISGYKLRSISNATPSTAVTLANARKYAANKGTGYTETTFYQYVYLQCMYLLQFKGNTDYTNQLGTGYVATSNAYPSSTGGSNTKGIVYGATENWSGSGHTHIKLFGIEDFWGNLTYSLDGCIIRPNGYVYTATDNFSDSYTNYTNHGRVFSTDVSHSGVMKDCAGTNELGFLPISCGGSSSNELKTYFCGFNGLALGGNYNTHLRTQGYSSSSLYSAGPFALSDGLVGYSGDTDSYNGARLAYL